MSRLFGTVAAIAVALLGVGIASGWPWWWRCRSRSSSDAARPTLDQRLDYFTVWPHLKNMVAHHNIFNFGRMRNVWREK